jgi:uncharacterized membrane protein
MSSPFLLLHICGAIAGLLSGAMAVIFRKGSGWHAAAGTVFFASMLGMTTSAAYIAAFLRPNRLNLLAATLTFYLVVTAWIAARRREARVGSGDRALLLLVLAAGLAGMTWGFQRVSGWLTDGMPAAAYFNFGAAALLCVRSDVRMLARGGVSGTQRITRHLWRMCNALLITALSFYPGQARLFPASWRETNLLMVPHLLLFGVMLFWLYRMSSRKANRAKPLVPSPAT